MCAIGRRRSGVYVCPLCNRRDPPPAMVSSLRWEDGYISAISRLHLGGMEARASSLRWEDGCISAASRLHLGCISAASLRWEDGSTAGARVCGSWGTKVTAVVRVILDLPEGAKCLVFSQWDEMLALIARALASNNVGYARLAGLSTFDTALDTWRRDPATVALLLPTRTGSNGLNLTEAQHVLLVEPLINPAVEAQATPEMRRRCAGDAPALARHARM